MKFEDYKLNPNWQPDILESYRRIYNEIINDHEYDRHGLMIKAGDTVVDLGSSIGTFSNFAVENQAEKVISMEADPETFIYLQKNCNDPRITCVNGFVCGNEKTARIISQGNMIHDLCFPGASMLLQNKQHDFFYDLPRIFQQFDLQKIDFLKMDVEGMEHNFFIDAPEQLLKKVKQISVEFHIHSTLTNDMRDFSNMLWIMSKLSNCGFCFKVGRIHKNSNLYMLYAINEKIGVIL